MYVSSLSGQEKHVLDNPHFRSSLAGLMHYTKVLRLFFRSTETTPTDDLNLTPTDPPTIPPMLAIASKVFHVEHCVRCDQVRLGSCHNFNQLPLAAHREVLSRVNEWLVHNGVWLDNTNNIIIYPVLSSAQL